MKVREALSLLPPVESNVLYKEREREREREFFMYVARRKFS
jgi:hypothetical protein